MKTITTQLRVVLLVNYSQAITYYARKENLEVYNKIKKTWEKNHVKVKVCLKYINQ
jgi:hypothetical protein